jgi:IclR family transcriptional regulator, KDG regulon repressor
MEGTVPALATAGDRRTHKAGSSKSLQKALRILLHVGQSDSEMGVTQLASALNLNKATVHRLLKAMEKFELIEKNPESEKYRLGLKLLELGTRVMHSRTLQSEAHRFLLDLAHRSSESISFAAALSGGVVCLDRVDSPNTVIGIRTPVGARFPAHCTAIGKLVLAYLPDQEVETIVHSAGLTRFTPFTITRLAQLKENLVQVRQRGYSIDGQELERGLSGVAAPVLSRDGRLLAGVGMAGPTLRFRGKELRQKIEQVRETAAKIAATFVTSSPLGRVS